MLFAKKGFCTEILFSQNQFFIEFILNKFKIIIDCNPKENKNI
jgi:hypothetical protein